MNVIQGNFRRPVRSDCFKVGDSFTSEDGIRVHVMAERQTDCGRQFLYKGAGTAVWASDTAFRRKS